ncbi:MAG: hypothetical protein M0Z78_10125 [Betaproteobacteria bacterium]|nr:hypothetical protein [Betaproteobacteria bacterium]
MSNQTPSKKVVHFLREKLGLLPPNYQTIVKGILSYLPGIYTFVDQTRSASTRFCYSVWMRHLVISWECGGLTSFPNSLLELGPGSSFGVGLAAMLTGTNRYYALDAIKFTDLKTNLETLDELVRLFQDRVPIPHGEEFTTEVRPHLKTYDFPTHILDDEHLKKCLSVERVQLIKEALKRAFSESDQKQNSKIQIFYLAPWSDYKVLPEGCADMILSNTVLQCVDNLSDVYESFHYWLAPDGFMSHNIDFSSYGATKEWNGHWACSKLEWSLMRGKRPYLINREPYSKHVGLLKQLGFNIVCDIKFTTESGIKRYELVEEFKDLSDDDLYTSGAMLQATR